MSTEKMQDAGRNNERPARRFERKKPRQSKRFERCGGSSSLEDHCTCLILNLQRAERMASWPAGFTQITV